MSTVEREVMRREERESRELKERVVEINRVAKVVKGGRRFSFTALVVIGDEHEKVGVGYGKAREVPLAISKAVEDAKKNLFAVPKHGTTITHEVLGRFDAAKVLLRPASEGTGVIAGGGVRAVLELGGVRNVLAKSLGTTNPINMAKATVVALQQLRRPEDVAKIRGKQISEVLPVAAATREEPVEEAPLAASAAVEPREPAGEAPSAPKKRSAQPKPETEASADEDKGLIETVVEAATPVAAAAADAAKDVVATAREEGVTEAAKEAASGAAKGVAKRIRKKKDDA